jgi:hypothetical protein
MVAKIDDLCDTQISDILEHSLKCEKISVNIGNCSKSHGSDLPK